MVLEERKISRFSHSTILKNVKHVFLSFFFLKHVFHNPSHVLFYCPKNSYYIWNLWNIVFVRVKMLGH